METITVIYIAIVALFTALAIAAVYGNDLWGLIQEKYPRVPSGFHRETDEKHPTQWLTKDQLIAAVHFQTMEITGVGDLKAAENVVNRLMKYVPRESPAAENTKSQSIIQKHYGTK